MKALKIAVLALVLVLVAGYMMLPTESSVERSRVVDAPRNVIFPLVNNVRRWPEWDPWTPFDPDMKREYKGPDAGVGAESHWDSETQEVGTGFFRIDESVAGEKVVMHLEFTKPFESASTGTITLADEGGGTRVTWHNYSKLEGPMMRFAGLFLDGMLGEQFDTGLANLAEIAEKEAATPLGQAKGTIEDVTDAAKKIGKELGIGE